jgi:integrase
MKQKNLVRIIPAPWSKSPWCVIVPHYWTGTKRVRRHFTNPEEAELYRSRILSLPRGEGYLKAEKLHNGSYEPFEGQSGAASLRQCAQLWLDRFRHSKSTFFQCRQVLRPLIARFGKEPIGSLGVRELDDWLRSLGSKYSFTTVTNYWRRTRHFFTYCHNAGWITSNPMMNPILKQPVRREKAKRHILRPEHMAKLLAAAQGDRVLTAYLCLGGFAGIRTSEILKMDWDDLFWQEGQIRIQAKEVETSDSKEIWIGEDDEEEDISGDRMVTMEAALRRHLEPLALKGGAIDAAAQRRPDGGRGSRKIIPGGQRTLYEDRAKLREVLGVKEWPGNCLRHSYKSYHAVFYRDLERTRLEMGHSDSNTTRYKYGVPRMRSVAEAWWAL